MSDLVAIERERGVAVVRLQRTDKHNAFNRDLAQATIETLDALDADDDVVCVVLTGAGKAFCAGADMTEAVAAIDENGRSDGMGAAVVRTVAFRKAIIGCINGFAYGGGAMLASACDFRIAAESASFRFPGAAYGLVVGGALLPRLIGPAMASELLFSTRVVRADEALRIGFVNRVVADADLHDVTLSLAREIAANSPEALIATKDVVRRAAISDAATALEAEWNRTLRASAQHHERFRAAAARVAARSTDDPN